jgi:hypothetical protein
MSSHLVEISRTVTCKRCGDPQVAWVKGVKSGKWYLAEALRDSQSGQLFAARFNIHKCKEKSA